MTDLREYGRRLPDPFRTRPDEPDPLRAFTGYTNGRTDPALYRAHLLRYTWHTWGDGSGEWMYPDSCWGATLCSRDAYPRRWRGGVDLILGGPEAGESYVPEVADMRLCDACAREWAKH